MKKSIIRNWLLTLTAILFLFVALQYLILSTISVRRVFVEANSSENGDQVDLNAKDSTWLHLFKQKNWLESRLKMAQADSIYLSINLQDSSIQLELKGVVLKSSTIEKLNYDHFFDALSANGYHHYFGQEASGIQTLASIDKVPLTVKKAPKDSAEFAAQSHVSDTLITQPTNWMMKLDNGIMLKIKGVNTADKSKKSSNSFWRHQQLQQVKTEFSKTLFFDVPKYNPTIEILINEADAKAIFRAIPSQPMVCIRL